MHLAIIGGGPAGLRAAEIASTGPATVTLFDARPSVGRKFLVAGRGGLNITKNESASEMLPHFSGPNLPASTFAKYLAAFDSASMRHWAATFGIDTFVASTGRVYPREMKAAALLRRWVHRLKDSGVRFHMRHRWTALRHGPQISLDFATPHGPVTHEADAVILALGGASWPETGSDANWIPILESQNIPITPFLPANSGWETPWPDSVLAHEGHPLKNITATANGKTAIGELMITRHGLEGGAIYQLGPALRSMSQPAITIDLKPSVSIETLIRKLGPLKKNFLPEAITRWRLDPAAASLLTAYAPAHANDSAQAIATAAKNLVIPLTHPRPIAEAISSAGGVPWSALDENLMLRALPRVYCAGEMIDWEAPTGGYLLQASFATATHTAKSALTFGADK